MLFLASKSERMKLSVPGLGDRVPVLRHFFLIHLCFTATLFQVMLPREQMQTNFLLRTGWPVGHFLFPHPLISSAGYMCQQSHYYCYKCKIPWTYQEPTAGSFQLPPHEDWLLCRSTTPDLTEKHLQLAASHHARGEQRTA